MYYVPSSNGQNYSFVVTTSNKLDKRDKDITFDIITYLESVDCDSDTSHPDISPCYIQDHGLSKATEDYLCAKLKTLSLVEMDIPLTNIGCILWWKITKALGYGEPKKGLLKFDV